MLIMDGIDTGFPGAISHAAIRIAKQRKAISNMVFHSLQVADAVASATQALLDPVRQLAML
jgi:hypothetical protein